MYAFLLWQLPHAIVAVSVITALLPAMSRFAADGELGQLRQQLDRGLRLTITLLVPAAVAYVVLGRQIATLVFRHGLITLPQARFIGTVLAVLACGLVAFSTYQLQLRAFYALQDTRTPALINLVVNVTAVAIDLALFALLPPRYQVLGLAAGQALSYLAGVGVCTRVLSRRVARQPQGGVLRTTARTLLAVAPGAALAAGVVALGSLLGHGLLASLAIVVVAGPLLGIVYVVSARRLLIAEVDEFTAPVLSRLRRPVPP